MTLETQVTLADETLDTLQDLVQINIDSRDGFREAAGQITDAALATYFRELADQRAQQAEELQTYVQLNNERPVRDGSFLAAVHRSWLSIRDSLTGTDVHAVLAEAERGEDAIKGAYEEGLKETAGSAINDVLQSQYAQVKAAHDRVRDLRDAHA